MVSGLASLGCGNGELLAGLLGFALLSPTYLGLSALTPAQCLLRDLFTDIGCGAFATPLGTQPAPLDKPVDRGKRPSAGKRAWPCFTGL